MVFPLVVQLLVLASPTLQPASVPAHGEQEATLTLDHASMVRLSAVSGVGTACTVVDHSRGPFQTAGAVGASDCALDLLLDPGLYRLRLSSPPKGKGSVALRAIPFAEQNAAPVRLEPGRSVEQPLGSGQQASYWVHLDGRGPVVVRVSGRTAGMVQLWRAGSWREDLAPHHAAPAPVPGQPIHEWWIETSLEAGDYLVTVYGTAPLEWTTGKPSDLVSVQLGIASTTERALAVTLPAWGSTLYALPAPPADVPGDLTAIASLEGAAAGPVRLAIHGTSPSSEQGACQIEPRAVVRECVAAASGRNGEGHLLSLHGPPGARVQVRWAPRSRAYRLVDGEYRGNASSLPIEALPSGEYLIGLHDVPADLDAAPLGCALFREPDGKPRELVAADLPRVAPGRSMDRAFNTTGEESVWFEVATSATYRLATDPARKERCELYRLDGPGTTRLSRTAEQPRCELEAHLEAGKYELRISGGGRGIDRLFVGVPRAARRDSPGRAACLMRVRLTGDAPYLLSTSRTGAAPVRGLVARPLPLTLAEPLPVEIPAGERLTLPVNVAGPIRVRAQGDTPVTCSLSRGGAGSVRDGACWVEARGQDQLVLTAPADAPATAWIARPATPPAPPPPLRAFSPAPDQLPVLAEATPRWLDLAPDEPHAFTFRVDAPGLYHARTEGLLATDCTLRTPTVVRLGHDARGGRGRNCLVAAYLDTGTYLLTVHSTGKSRGRAAVVLEHRPVHDLAPTPDDGEAFFRVPAGELVRQRLTVSRPGPHDLSTVAPGAALQCRLEDAGGWPLVAVPAPCAAQLDLPRGELLWTQMPLTVESMRHTRLAQVRPPVVLRGDQPHPVALWERYAVELSKGGHDTFTFTLEADLDLFVDLTGGMQGRITREGENRPVELVPARDEGSPGTAAPQPAGDETSEVDETGAPEDEGAADASQAAEDGDEHVSEGEGEEAPEPKPPRPPAPTRVTLGPPPGRRVALAAGRYRLVTEHSRGDVAIAYELQLSTEVLTPGVTRDLSVPSRVTVRMPRSETLRLRTRGDADVRCRLFDAGGRLVAESSDVGADWNCGLAQPLPPGDYTLDVESETQAGGQTRLSLSAPATLDAGALENGKRYRPGDHVLVAALPATAGDPGRGAVVDVGLESSEPFSCAIEDAGGAVVFSQLETRSCRALLHPLGRAYRVRLWSLEQPAEVAARLTVLPTARLVSGKSLAATAGLAEIAHPGRYRTAEGVQCLPAGEAGPLLPCGPEVSLEGGPILFASAAGEARIPLEEITPAIDERRAERLQVTRRALVEVATSRTRAVHLLRARAALGERAAPWCGIEGGVETPGTAGEAACYAASSPTQRSTGRVFAPSDAPVEVELVRQAVPLPAVAGRIDAGRQVLTLPAAAARFSLPSGPARLELLLPPETWGVLLAGDRTVDLCAPSSDLARCVLQPRGGELLVFAPRERRVEATLVVLPSPPQELTLGAEPWEARAAPGTILLRAPRAPAPRILEIAGAQRCLIRLSDGTRLAGCSAQVPPGVTAEAVLDTSGSLRAILRPAGSSAAAVFGRALSAAPPAIRPGEAAALGAALVERSFTLPAPSLVHVQADTGVCALTSGAELLAVDGMGSGCTIDQLLPAGTHRLAVRPFAAEPLAGTVRLTTEPVEALSEGVGAERWIAPGQTRLFQFHAAARGKVGIGLRQAAEVLECTVLDAGRHALATGCQALIEVDGGDYLLAVRAPASVGPARFRPVVLGLAGAQASVPDEYLRDLFRRIGDHPRGPRSGSSSRSRRSPRPAPARSPPRPRRPRHRPRPVRTTRRPTRASARDRAVCSSSPRPSCAASTR